MADFIDKDDPRALSRRSFLEDFGHGRVGCGAGRDRPRPWARRRLPKALPRDRARSSNRRTKSAWASSVPGEQGRVLLESCLRIPGVRIAALCDIWEYSRQYASGYLGKYGQKPVVYEDYRDMLAKEKSLDAAIVATPDWVHAEHANACLEAGLHVYCEKEMSNSLEKARTMVETSRRTGKLLQIGHQRRSNPRYIHAIDRLIRGKALLGRVGQAYAQWNRSKADMLGWPKKYVIDQATLQKYGYDSMAEFRNWRWYKKFGGGPIVDLGSHQIDLFSWVFGVNPDRGRRQRRRRLLQEPRMVRQRHGHLRIRNRRRARPAPSTRSRRRPPTAASTKPSWAMTVPSSSPKSPSAATGRCGRRTPLNGIPSSRTGSSSPRRRPSRSSRPAISSSTSG